MIEVFAPLIVGFIFLVISIGFSSYSEYIGWNKGYDAACKTYKDWNKGFDSGWKAASKRFVDYDLGFKDGWQAAKEEDS